MGDNVDIRVWMSFALSAPDTPIQTEANLSAIEMLIVPDADNAFSTVDCKTRTNGCRPIFSQTLSMTELVLVMVTRTKIRKIGRSAQGPTHDFACAVANDG